MKKFMMMLAITSMVLAGSSLTKAGPQLIDNEADLLATSLKITTYDFEQSSGFPSENNYIGALDNIIFDAQIHEYSRSTSGTQSMTGQSGTGTIATLDFSNIDNEVIGFGFYGLDLTHSTGLHTEELIRVTVHYKKGTELSYDVMLPPEAPWFTPVYFGLIDVDDPIESIQLYGTDLGLTYPARRWIIDDLTVVVPEPATLSLLAIGALSILRRRKA